MPSVSMRQMLEAGVHFGHQTRFWNPKMAPFIFGERNKIHIINLEKTQPMYSEAAGFIKGVIADGGTVLFVGTKRSARDSIQKEAERASQPYVNQRWLGGMLTNFKTIRQSIKRLGEITELAASGALDKRGKKEATQLRREMDKLEKSLVADRSNAQYSADNLRAGDVASTVPPPAPPTPNKPTTSGDNKSSTSTATPAVCGKLRRDNTGDSGAGILLRARLQKEGLQDCRKAFKTSPDLRR